MTVIFVLQPPRGLLLLLLLVIGVVVRPFSLETTSQRPTAFPNSVQVQPEDIDTFIRQTGQLAPSKAAIGIPATCNCRHGFAQAFAMDPFPQDRLNSGLLKLTCPHLVRAVDALEDDNMIGEVNKRLETSDELQSAMEKSHKLHATTRNELLDDGALQTLQSKLGQKGTQAFLESGVAGASQGGNDVKCLHAWLADSLFTPSSKVGQVVANELENCGVDLRGTENCWACCDPAARTVAPEPPVARNKQRLKTRKEILRRKRRKSERNPTDDDNR